jgi:hypothetical protein
MERVCHVKVELALGVEPPLFGIENPLHHQRHYHAKKR